MTKPVWSHVLALHALDFKESSLWSITRKPQTRLQIPACKANSSPTQLYLPNHI